MMSYIDIVKQEGAEVIISGKRKMLTDDIADGYYVEPTLLKGHTKMRRFQ
ncbi:MAG: aldehyde dehydrogenase [Methylophagaceae bacterium]|jgi:aldehyde dehydrogenase